MKFCMPHWNALREAIRSRKMWVLVAPNGLAASRRIQDELDGVETDATYDPLMAAHWMISNKALEYGGLYLMTGDYCPLCEVAVHGPDGIAEEWINGCTDSILEYVKSKHMPLDDEPV